MSSWRVIAAASGAATLSAGAMAWTAGTWALLLPAVAACAVLGAAALAVDFFGLSRRREAWYGGSDNPRGAALRARTYARRFRQLKEQGSPRTARAARSWLIALADGGRLREAGPAVDFLGADAVFARVGADPVADALRAAALAELGRLAEARPLAGSLLASRRCRRLPVVRYAWARVAELDRRPEQALAQIEEALARRCPAPLRRDLVVLQARCLVRLGRVEKACEALRALAASGRRGDVQRVADTATETGEAGLCQAARQALAAASPYR